jgi:hypothetical protein
MTWTYAAATRCARNLVRERIGDAESGRPLVADEVIAGFLVAEGTTETATDMTDAQVVRASVGSARVALATMLRLPDRSVESVSVTRARIDLYRDLLRDLEAEAGMSPAVLATMSAGGVSKASDDAIMSDSDYDRTPFGSDLWDRPDGVAAP